MKSIAIRRWHGAGVLPARTLTTVALLGVLLLNASGAAATSLIAAHAPGGEIHTTMAQSAGNQDVAVSRSVGLMDSASGSADDADLGYSTAEVSRSVGLMDGAAG